MGPDVNMRDIDEMTALHYAAEKGFYECINLLIEAKTDVNALGRFSGPPLLCATKNLRTYDQKHKEGIDNFKCSQMLIQAGADVNLSDKNNTTAVYYAAKHGKDEVVQSLIEKGADIDDMKSVMARRL